MRTLFLLGLGSWLITGTALADSGIDKHNTLLFNGFLAPGFGEVAVRSQEVLDQKSYVFTYKVGWQLLRAWDVASLTIGYGGADISKWSKSGDDAPHTMDMWYNGPTAELILFPGSIVYGSASYLAGKGSLLYRATEDAPQQKEAVRATDVTVSLIVSVGEYAGIVLSAGQQKFRTPDDALLPKTEETHATFSLGFRGSLL